MSIPDNPYEPPHADVASPHSTFSPDEWRTMAKVFGGWVLGGALVLTAVLALQMNMALSQFGGQEYLARVMMISVTNQYASMLIVASICNTLVMVTERRAKRNIFVPVQRLPLIVPIFSAFAVPIAMIVMLALTIGIAHGLDIPLSASWKGLEIGFHGIDVALSTLAVLLLSAALSAHISQLMEIFLRYRGRLILKCLIVTQVSGFVLYVIQRVLGFLRN